MNTKICKQCKKNITWHNHTKDVKLSVDKSTIIYTPKTEQKNDLCFACLKKTK